jgi:hypothetical protein
MMSNLANRPGLCQCAGMKDAIADILADYAEKIRALEPSDDYSLEKLILHHWETFTVQTVRTFTEHGIKPTDLMFLLMAAVEEAAPGTLEDSDNAVMQMALRCRLMEDSPQ